MFKAMHNRQHYRGKDLEWRKSIKKKGGEKGEKDGRKEERFTSGSMAGMQGGRNA